MKKSLIVVGMLLCLAVSVAAQTAVESHRFDKNAGPEVIYNEQGKPYVWASLSDQERANYLKTRLMLDKLKLYDVAIAGFKHNYSLTPYDGIGIVVGYHRTYRLLKDQFVKIDFRLQVIGLWRNAPAEQAGLRIGDIVTAINGVDVGTERIVQNPDDVSPRMQTDAMMKVFRTELLNADTAMITVERGSIHQNYQVRSALIGEKLSKELAKRMSGWEKQLRHQRKYIPKLEKRLAQAGTNHKRLVKINKDLNELWYRIHLPEIEARNIQSCYVVSTEH